MEDKLAKNNWKPADTAEENEVLSDAVSVAEEEEVGVEDREEDSKVVVVSGEDLETRSLLVTDIKGCMFSVIIIVYTYTHTTMRFSQ